MAQNIFFELSIVILIAMVISIVMKMLRQPLIIGYILTGVIAGPFLLNLVKSSDFLVGLSEIGIAFLLFIVGLNLNLKNLKEVGFVSFLVGFGQVGLTFLIGYMVSLNLGFSSIESAFISMALTFSSTIIVVKILSDKKDIDSLYGKITVGILLVQDLVVIFILMFISTSYHSGTIADVLFSVLVKVVALIILLIIASNYVMPRIVHFMAKSQELLFLFSIGWVMIISTLIYKAGLSIEIGALFAGVSLASSPYHYEMGSKIKPLRDFFVIMFFVLLGSQMIFDKGNIMVVPIIFLSILVLFLKTLIVMMIMGIIGYHRKVGFDTGLSLAQISEFSLVLVLIGYNSGQISRDIVSLVTAVGLITIAISAYLMQYNGSIYRKISKLLVVFEKKRLKDEFLSEHKDYKIILFGYNRIGYSLLKSFRKIKKSFLVIDFNPDVIKLLKEQYAPYKYGDVGDAELLDELNLNKIEMGISTIPDVQTNLLLVSRIREVNANAVVIITCHQIDDAFKLYEAGADYVIMPHFLGGEHTSTLIEKFGTKVNNFIREKYRHIEELKKRKHIGHEHPRIHH